MQRGAPPRPLRVGIMLRAVDEVDGAGVYIRKLCGALFDVDPVNEYTLLYRNAGLDVPVDAASITVPGLIAHEDMPAVYSMAAALVFPSFHESFGIPIVEAMRCGCPVITSNLSACPEVAGDAGLLVDPVNVEAIAGAMLRVIEEPGLAAELRERGLRQAAGFSWAASASHLLTELRDVAGS